MKRLTLCASSIGVIAALIGCGGNSGPGVVPVEPPATASGKNGELMPPAAKKSELLYVSAAIPAINKLYVFTYPDAAFVGTIAVPNHPLGLCTDKAGNVFVTTIVTNSATSYVYEYAHGGTQPIATLTDPGEGNGCAVDPLTGNLAVANWSSGSASGDGDVAIYQNASGTPVTYATPSISAYWWCAYDDEGNLFVDGINGSHAQPMAELPKGASSFENVTLSAAITPSSLQWLNGNLIIADDASISGSELLYRVKFTGTKGKVLGRTALKSRHEMNSWGGEFVVSGSEVAGPSYPRRYFSVWSYPKGGKALHYATRGSVNEFYGVAISASR
jgi:hypothetical protein